MVPGGEQPGDPGAGRLRLHARLPGRAVLARQPPEHDPRRHARHPGARPARAARWRCTAARAWRCWPRASSSASTVRRALPTLAEYANALGAALERVGAATKPAWATGNPEEALANATPYLQAFGHMVLAWMWLDVARCASEQPGAGRCRRGCAARQTRRLPLFLPLRTAAPGSLAEVRGDPRRHLPKHGRERVLTMSSPRMALVTWVLIYAGMLSFALGWRCARTRPRWAGC